jgi:Mg-chelatase subunit ChlD
MNRFLLVLSLIALPLMAAKTGAIEGSVNDSVTGAPIGGATIGIEGSNLSTKSDKKGDFLLKGIPGGNVQLTVVAKGYGPLKSSKIKVRPGKTTSVKLKLNPVKAADWKATAEIHVDKLNPKAKDAAQTHKDLKAPPKAAEEKKVNAGSSPSLARPGEPASEETVESLHEETVETDDDMDVHDPASPSPLEWPQASIPMLTKPGSSTSGTESSTTPKPGKTTASEPKTESASPARPEKKSLLDFFSWDSDEELPKSMKTASSARPTPRKPQGGLKAGYADDNQQFNYFLGFLQKYAHQVDFYPYDISERIQIIFKDSEGRSVPNVDIKIRNDADQIIDSGLSYSDGTFFFYPAQVAQQDQVFQLEYAQGRSLSSMQIERAGPRQILVTLPQIEHRQSAVPVDIVFILDTTGSMGEEIKRLLETIDIIHMNLTALPNLPEVRFGMVLYRDRSDAYVTKVIHPTNNINKFRTALTRVTADGGGDTPEDLQSALKETMETIQWNHDGLRLGFVITDATAHLDYVQEYTYIKAAETARQKGIKLFTVGTGGLDIHGEYILRQISQLTYAKYLFLTYGQERGENSGGRAGSVSHHTGSNYQTDKLEAIIIRIAKEEISNFTDTPTELGEDYFTAESVDFESREETLALLFHDAINRLVDYSSIRIENAPKLGVLPVNAKDKKTELSAEYFTEQIQLSVSNNKQFTLIARKDLQKILEEQKLQLSGLLSDTETTQLGELLGAELLLSAELYEQPQGYDLFLKLLRVETAEILAVTKIVMDKNLGL